VGFIDRVYPQVRKGLRRRAINAECPKTTQQPSFLDCQPLAPVANQ